MKKKIGIFIVLVLVVGLGFFFLKGNLFKTDVMSTNQNTLVQNFEKHFPEKVVKVFIDDFDANGVQEAFILTGKLAIDAEKNTVWREGKVWFANERGTKMVQDGFSTQTTFNPEVMTLDEIKVLHVYQESAKEEHSFLFGVVDGKPYTYFDCPLGRFGQENGALYVRHVTNDGKYDATAKKFTEQTAKRYYFYCEKVNEPCKIKIREYGAVKISLAQFLQFTGAQDIYNSLNHPANFATIGDILYRGNKTITINYEILEENGYSRLYHDLKIKDDGSVNFDGVGSGNYETALFPEIASYPVFQSPQGKSALTQPQALYEYERNNGERFFSPTILDGGGVVLVDTHELNRSCMVKDRFYFSDDQEVVKYLDANGQINSLEFTRSSYNLYFDWQISADGRKIAWIEDLEDSADDNDDLHGTFVVNVADLDGGNRKRAVRELGYEEVLLIDQLVNHDVYYGTHVCALDEPEYLSDLYKLNGETGKNEFIFGETPEEHEKRFSDGHSGEFISAVAEGGSLIAYFKEGKLNVWDVKAQKTNTLALPEKGNSFYGVRFSPDGKKVAFAGFEDGEKKDTDAWPTVSCFYVEDLETRKISKVETIQQEEDGPPEYHQVEWKANDTLLINGKTITLEQ